MNLDEVRERNFTNESDHQISSLPRAHYVDSRTASNTNPARMNKMRSKSEDVMMLRDSSRLNDDFKLNARRLCDENSYREQQLELEDDWKNTSAPLNYLRVRNNHNDSIDIFIGQTNKFPNKDSWKHDRDTADDEVSLQSEEDVESVDNRLLKGKEFSEIELLCSNRKDSAFSREKGQLTDVNNGEFDLSARAQERGMTMQQELWNAITMLIAPCYCLYYIFSGMWISNADLEAVKGDTFEDFHNASCIYSSTFTRLHAIPPSTVIAVALGIIVHAPASILYHLLCAFRIPQGPERIDHWSRRLDQAMIHVMSMFWSFGSSGNWDYLLASMAFNAESIYRLYQQTFRPRRVLMRMVISVLIQTLPFLHYGETLLCIELVIIYITSGWIFSRYPFGGYSHGIFHIGMAMAPPLVIAAAAKLPVVQDQVRLAAMCAISKKEF